MGGLECGRTRARPGHISAHGHMGTYAQNDRVPIATPPCVVDADEEQPPARTSDEDVT
jgi:hypothetical protein